MEFVIVSFKEHRNVLVDGIQQGTTNQPLMVVRGHHHFTLDGDQNYQPEFVEAVIQNTTAIKPFTIEFT